MDLDDYLGSAVHDPWSESDIPHFSAEDRVAYPAYKARSQAFRDRDDVQAVLRRLSESNDSWISEAAASVLRQS